jgi:hypothetical protein
MITQGKLKLGTFFTYKKILQTNKIVKLNHSEQTRAPENAFAHTLV